MKINEIYELALKMGVANDPRGKAGVKHWLTNEKKKYDKLSKDEKALFDTERLTNPYADTRIHNTNSTKTIKIVACGIEIEEAEIALIKALDRQPLTDDRKNESNNGERSTVNCLPDLLITHHPVGKALAALDDVMHMQAEMMASYGVPINIAEGVMHERIAQVSRSLSPVNHSRAVDAAKFANMNYINIHTPCDNLVFQFLQNLMDKKKPETVGEIIELLKTVPEYKEATKNNAGPVIFAGAGENYAGKIVAFDITGGTGGAKEIYPELAKAGVGTIIGMHMKEENREEAIKNHMNVVIAGHISSDSLGLNLFLDELTTKGITVVPMSGLIRVKRTK